MTEILNQKDDKEIFTPLPVIAAYPNFIASKISNRYITGPRR
jgi:hypothetical protein